MSVGGSDPGDLRPDILRSSVALVSEPEIFEGSIADNVHLRRPGVSTNAVRSALEKVGLLDQVLTLPDGIDTKMNASGAPLSSTQQRLLMFARAIVGEPSVLVVDGVFDALPDIELATLMNRLTADDRRETLIVMTGKSSIADRLPSKLVLMDDGGGDEANEGPERTNGDDR